MRKGRVLGVNDLALDMLSRSEGIETKESVMKDKIKLTLWICFPVRRELKLFDKKFFTVFCFYFGYAFPFGGN